MYIVVHVQLLSLVEINLSRPRWIESLLQKKNLVVGTSSKHFIVKMVS